MYIYDVYLLEPDHTPLVLTLYFTLGVLFHSLGRSLPFPFFLPLVLAGPC